MKIELEVRELCCSFCKRTIENGLTEKPGVASCVVDVDAGKAQVAYNESELSKETIIHTVENLGFEAWEAATT